MIDGHRFGSTAGNPLISASLHYPEIAWLSNACNSFAALYRELARIHPSAVVALNHAVAVALSEGLETGLKLIDELGSSAELHSYHLYHAARADILRRLGRSQEAIDAYRQALGLTANAVERRYLNRRLAELARQSR